MPLIRQNSSSSGVSSSRSNTVRRLVRCLCLATSPLALLAWLALLAFLGLLALPDLRALLALLALRMVLAVPVLMTLRCWELRCIPDTTGAEGFAEVDGAAGAAGATGNDGFAGVDALLAWRCRSCWCCWR